jgi:hypothetical protein
METPMNDSSQLWVRLKPRNEKKGIKLRRYLAFGMRFDEASGWYIVDSTLVLQDGRQVNVGEYLRNVRNDNEDEDSPLAFDVMTEQEARALDARERKAAEVRATAMDARPVLPSAMTSADLGPLPAKVTARSTPGISNGPEELAKPARPRGRPKRTAA